MLAAAHRLRRRAEFAATIRAGRRSGRGSVVIHLCIPSRAGAVAATPSAEVRAPARAGFVVSRAVGGAVIRNLVRRRLRELVRDRLAALPSGAEVVVRALPAAATRSYAELATDLDSALSAALDSRSTAGRRRARGPEPGRGESQ